MVRRTGPGFAQLKIVMADLHGVRARVGWFDSARYADGTPVAYVASIQEYGSGPIPPRSFMRTTVAEQSDKWMRQIAQGARAVMDGRFTATQVIETVGLGAASDIAKKIASITTPPLSPVTLQARQNDPTGDKRHTLTGKKIGEFARFVGPINVSGSAAKPLVWSGQMIQSVTAVVDKAA